MTTLRRLPLFKIHAQVTLLKRIRLSTLIEYLSFIHTPGVTLGFRKSAVAFKEGFASLITPLSKKISLSRLRTEVREFKSDLDIKATVFLCA